MKNLNPNKTKSNNLEKNKRMKIIQNIILLIILSTAYVQSQDKNVNVFKKKYLNWYNLDINDNQVLGASVNKTYQELLVNKKSKKTIIVAIIDGGIDINHEDLNGKIWINKGEIPNNNIDDDHNGYIDDINGWNFIGNSNGENINYENLECTRIYKLSGTDDNYQKAKKIYEEELAKKMKEKENLLKFETKYNNAKFVIKNKTNIEINKPSDLYKVSSTDNEVLDAVNFLMAKYKEGFSEKSFFAKKARNEVSIEKHLNVNFNPRTICGDDPNNINDCHYGNSNVIGPRASHGTSVAGIIAGIRNNGKGIDGIAEDVKIMVLRTTPNGDERDKDVALAIKYAVENGADIINMSFGKALSPQKKFIDDAIRLAEQKNVLIIHSAGNDGEDTNLFDYFPSDYYLDKSEAINFINIGACGMEKGSEMASIFSNYGMVHVDVFAPGESIISLDTNNTYNMHSGTSEAAPVVTGIAALVLSYHPELTPKELISILLDSSLKLKKQKVLKPDLINEKRKKVKFGTLSKSGGVINAYEAMKLAENFK